MVVHTQNTLAIHEFSNILYLSQWAQIFCGEKASQFSLKHITNQCLGLSVDLLVIGISFTAESKTTKVFPVVN